MKKIHFSAITACLFLIGCYPASKLIVQPVNSDFKPSTTGFFYSLPRTMLEVKLQLVHSVYIPGPYCQYATQFLGIEGVQLERKDEWSIASASVNSYVESDPENIFYAGFTAGKPSIPDLLTLTENGLIFLANSTLTNSLKIQSLNGGIQDSVWFTNLSMDRFYFQKTDTLYKTVLRDSTLVQIPVLKKEEIQKTDEEKAKEAANAIIKLRKRRFKLLSGEYNFITEGAALEITVRELDKMEKEYLSLFLGKHFTESQTYTRFILPAAKTGTETICRFSREQGIVPPETKPGLPVILTILRENSEIGPDVNIAAAENSLYFRIPENSTLQLSISNKVVSEKRIAIYQFGKIQIMPVIPRSFRHRWMR